MSVIISRALPDVRDGLKPVHRRVLYAMYDMGNTWDKPYKKSARLVGDVIGKYHPPWRCGGLRYDRPVGAGFLDALSAHRWPGKLRLHRSRSSRGHALHRDPDGPSRRRAVGGYRKRDRRFHSELRRLLKEPAVLPSRIPNLLVNGASGIAVGMATNIRRTISGK